MAGFKAIAKLAPVYVTAKIFAAEDTDQIVFIADRDYEVREVAVSLSAGDAAGTLMLDKCPSGTAIGSGTDLLVSAFDLNATADTPVFKSVANGGVVSSVSSRTLVRGDALGLDFGGTLNDTFQGVVQILLQPVSGS